MPDGKDDPSPEDLEVKVDALLTGAVDLWVPVHVLVVHVLLKREGDEAGPGGPESVVEGLEPVGEKDLS